jgi:chemotaxis family two-component system response regulator Rcp1
MIDKIVSLVDDDPGFVSLVEEVFRQTEFEIDIISFSDGEALIDWAIQNHSVRAVVLLDLNLPDMKGIEIISRIRKLGLYWPIVIFTSSPYIEDVVEAYKGGANSYIKKPYGLNGLRECLRTFVKYWFDYCELP